MENASKALIIAGETLIGLIVISLIVYAFSVFGSFSANMNEKMSEKTAVTYNQHFWEYQGRIDISAEEIASIVNFAKESNDKNELSFNDSSSLYVNIYINNDSVFGTIINESEYNDTNQFKSKIREFISQNNTFYYYCSINKSKLAIKPTTEEENKLWKNEKDKKAKKIIVQMEDNGDIMLNDQNMVNKIVFHTLPKIGGINFNIKENTLDEYLITDQE